MKAKLDVAFTGLRGWMARALEFVSRISGREPAPLMRLAFVAIAGVFVADWCFRDAANVAKPFCLGASEFRESAWFLAFWHSD